MRLHCFLTVNSLVNAAGDHLAGGGFMEKALNYLKNFPRSYVISPCGEQSRQAEGARFESYSTLFFFFFLFFRFLCCCFL